MRKNILYILFAGLFAANACQKRTYEYVYPTLGDGKYDSEFPYRSCSRQMEDISRSVMKIYSLADYNTYHFGYDKRYLLDDLMNLDEDSLLRRCSYMTNSFEARNGTSTIIYYEPDFIALLTLAHVIHYPERLFTYYEEDTEEEPTFLESVSVLANQHIFFTGHNQGKDLEIIAIDLEMDLAIAGKKNPGENTDISVFDYPLGDSKSLEWGNFVYIMGYPLGHQMVTRGIVSKPARRGDDIFLIDASFNEGFSGGVVLAIRDGVPNFELVGLGKSASASFENILVPEKKEYERRYNDDAPYQGDIYVNLRKEVNYGVTKAISSNAIIKFYDKHRKDILEKGYNLDGIFTTGTGP